MRIIKTRTNKEFKKIYVLDNGIVIRIPKYKKTSIYFGDKKCAINRGVIAKGNKNFYITDNGIVIKDGYVAEEIHTRELDIKTNGNLKLNKNNVDDFINIIKKALEEEDRNVR